ncbi:MAG: DNA mismatch repair endonuclease MutL [Elusimicrobia bacterium]|nr:DNA mismatch repair endonuclease MutL [Elusimicrobiota bacterium]
MNRIKILPLDIVNKIAAGEVIERPASVVKELVENSLDANAKYITIMIKKSGKELISVSDDGCGMTKEDAVLSIKRHSTSKISDITDLEKIYTLGFRGEALPSIASISNMEIVTRTNDSNVASSIKIENGNVVNLSEIGAPCGTTVEVKNIFMNVPARLKFLKSETTEKNKIISLITEYAISYYNVYFRLISDDKEVFTYSPADNLEVRLAQIFGNEFIRELLSIELKHEQISICGFVSKPEKTFLNRNRSFVFINRRPVNSRIIVSAVKNGYEEYLKKKENPAMFLFFEINPESIDVNVHPTKREIKFKDENAVYSLVYQAIRSRILTKESIPAVASKIDISKPVSDYARNISSKSAEYIAQEFSVRQTKDSAESKPLQVKYIGRIFELYILIEDNGNLLIIDQHAAQEKILYEKFKRQINKKTLEIQHLLIPVNIELSPKEFNILQGLKDNLENLGFEIEEFGKNTFVVKSVPAIIGDVSIDVIIAEVIRKKKSGEISDTSDEITENLIKTACKTAIKSGDKLSEMEVSKLLDELFKCSNPYTCPHGRPTIIQLTKDEIDKRFLRK